MYKLKPGWGSRTRRMMTEIGNRPLKEHSAQIQAKCKPWRKKGESLQKCADRLNELGKFSKQYLTFRGFNWKPCRLGQVLSGKSIFDFTKKEG